jgi:hypothetical protein
MYVSTYVIPQLARPARTNTTTMSTSRPPVVPWIASSRAYLTRRGGASAVTVAARRENAEKAVRAP